MILHNWKHYSIIPTIEAAECIVILYIIIIYKGVNDKFVESCVTHISKKSIVTPIFYFMYDEIFHLSMYNSLFKISCLTTFSAATDLWCKSLPPYCPIFLIWNEKIYTNYAVPFLWLTLPNISWKYPWSNHLIRFKDKKTDFWVVCIFPHIFQTSVVTPTFFLIFGCS